jgi:inositol-phosphate phosphatase/L-galactose 1-phosphate phosphatase/histidinol-phosphatase
MIGSAIRKAMDKYIQTVHELADAAGKIIAAHYRSPFEVETKADHSPVTVADRGVEARLREIIESRFPQDGIWGEEFGIKDSQNGMVWVIDPIDGTKSFVIGRPTFGTLIALCRDGVPILGVIDQPILKERWIGMEGQQTLFNGTPVQTRKCADLAHAICSSTTPAMFKGDERRIYETLDTQAKAMVWGADCYSYGLLASGYVDVVVEAQMSPYDYLALVPIIDGAGGHITDWNGEALTLNSGDKVLALGDKALFGEMQKVIFS